MKYIHKEKYFPQFLIIVLSVLIISVGCSKMQQDVPVNAQNTSDAVSDNSVGDYQTTILVANTSGYGARRIDANLHNAWGMSTGPSGGVWVSAADGGVSYVYNNDGDALIPPVTIPSHFNKGTGSPTGNIFNPTAGFVIPGTGRPALFIFVSEDGIISGWNGGSSAITVADHATKGASYTGLTIAKENNTPFLYVANFAQHKVDVFDTAFHHVSGRPFHDPKIPDAYSPFNIREIHGMLYVTYAVVAKNGDDSTGKGLGFVDVYWPNGKLSKRLAAHGTLNAPWGLSEAKNDFLGSGGVLVGNFGDGRINVFDWDGNFKGQLAHDGKPIKIEGLWAIDDVMPKTSSAKLYFTAGPNDEEDGIFGFIKKK